MTGAPRQRFTYALTEETRDVTVMWRILLALVLLFGAVATADVSNVDVITIADHDSGFEWD